MNYHLPEVRCTGTAQCPVPHNRWLVESVKQDRFVPVKGLTVPTSLIAAEMLGGTR